MEDIVRRFSLEILAGKEHLRRTVEKAGLHHPGLEFINHFDFLPAGHIQVLGKNEGAYLQRLDGEERRLRIENVLTYNPPCVIVTDNQEGLVYLTEICETKGIPLLRTSKSTYELMGKLDAYLVKQLAPEMAVHGVCVNVSGIGILLRGKSGVGKSETAHTLLGRGHRLIADDIVVLKKLSPQTLLGTHNETNKEFLALRSVGLLNVVRLYGRKAFQEETRITLDIELTKWKDNMLNNELEIETKHKEYMGVRIPHMQIQLQPGRDVAGLIEAAANNWYLQQQGYNAAEEFMKRVKSDLSSHNE